MKKILLVDDSTSIRVILKSSLISDYEVYEAINGEDALNIINGLDIDLFLLDVNMPAVDGLTLCRELRKILKYKDTPIIMLTTETKEEKKEEGKLSGANGWIIKPCDPVKLLSAIKKFI